MTQRESWHCFQFISSRAISSNVVSSSPKKNDLLQELDGTFDQSDSSSKSKYRSKTLDYKQKIYLKDQFGRMLGLKTRDEANKIAQNHKLLLVEDDATKKILTLKMVDPRKKETSDEVRKSHDKTDVGTENRDEQLSPQKDHSSKHHQKGVHPKTLVFFSKVTDHDLQTKLRQSLKWVCKGQETVIRITSPVNDHKRLVSFHSYCHNVEPFCMMFRKKFFIISRTRSN